MRTHPRTIRFNLRLLETIRELGEVERPILVRAVVFQLREQGSQTDQTTIRLRVATGVRWLKEQGLL